ncbi:sodium:calcium antiporter [Salinimonas chungwhensis]|uniref:sodium:calcium antiporter n=1 Tax=Salinimonas chungwhensis TaxID=265425 RepID=UPI000362A684|nr:hypothetical protein [Salinimonas chungwhensis]
MFESLSLTLLLAAFFVACVAVVLSSIRATRLADIIADRTRMGEAMAGGLILGGATSLAGVVVSVNAALDGNASFAFSNAVGGIAAQTLFLAIADTIYKKVNLEHAAAEPTNLFQGVMLIVLLSMPLCALAGPEVAYFGVHPISGVLFVTYLYGVGVSSSISETPMWKPVMTFETRKDEPENENEAHKSARGPIVSFIGLVLVMGAGGWVISQIGGIFITRFGLTASLVGSLITAVVTSLPELVTTLVAVRRGALQLAVGGIIGGNTFDTLFLVFSDISYREGSLYHAVGTSDLYWLGTGILMTSILLAGLIARQRRGPGGIGVESVAMLGIYFTAAFFEIFR